MNKAHMLDPKLKPLLDDHFSGYIWIHNIKGGGKYKGRVLFTYDLSVDLRKAITRKRWERRNNFFFFKFKTHGYIFGNVDFVKILEASEPTAEGIINAQHMARELSDKLRSSTKATASRRMVESRYGVGHKPRRIVKQPGSRGEMRVWIWGFVNDELGKSFPHIFHFKDSGEEFGKRRRAFCDYYGLRYERMSEVASGKRAQHRGWRLIKRPRKVTRRQAIIMKIKQLEKENK